MKTKPISMLILMLTLLAQAACAPSSASACPTPTADTKLLTNAEDGYCLLYPAEDSAEMPGFVVINPIAAAGDMPGEAWVNIQVQDAAGRTAAQVAEEAITAAGAGFNITRMEVPVDGGQAIVLDGLPGFDSNRIVITERNERLYILTFLPWRPGAAGSGQVTPLEHLYETMMQSIHFTPPA
jgi:hypothetical protein